ncbi:MAG TPA: hypothetical protein VHU77_04355 [Candidatus Limnocylindria bacterium]|jgi:hypothetical protein|nr:hypothetical protein [Candidatus Limnocylindria bacterium]
MSDFQRNPGSIDDPGMKGGLEPEMDSLPPGDTADDTGNEPQVGELDLPGPDDPVAWSYIEPGTPVTGREGVKVGSVEAMLGTEAEGIFHGIALHPASGGRTRVIPADAVSLLTTSEVQIQLSVEQVEALPEFDETAATAS